MKILYKIGSIIIFVATFAHANNMGMRAPRIDALPLGGTQQIVVAESVQLAQIKQCVCNLTTLLNACCSSLDMQISGVASVLENDLESIIDILSNISNVDVYISSFELLFSLVEAIDRSLIETLVQTIQGLDSAFDHVSELIDSDIFIDQETLSKVSKIETQTETIISLLDILVNQNCASENDALLTELDYINSNIDAAIALATEILDIDQTVVSTIEKIETQLDTVSSLIDFAIFDCSSRSDVMIGQVQSLQEQEAQCCAQLSSGIEALQQDIDSRLEAIENAVEGIDIISQLEILESLIDNFDSALMTSLIDTTESGFDVITTQLDSLAACGSTPITAATTITTPGNYCLDQDITGNITIASSDVTFDLNGHTLAGSVIINTGLSRIVVTNGFIVPTVTSSEGVLISDGCDTVSLTFLSIDCINSSGSFVGVDAGAGVDITNLYISDVLVQNSSLYGMLLVNCVHATIVNSAADACASRGFLISDSTSVTIKNCVAANNLGAGFDIGFHGGIIENCTAYSNGDNGFNISEGQVSNCFAFENVSAGYSITGGNSLINGCVAMENGGPGFDAAANANNVRYTNNYATDNTVVGSTVVNYALAGVAVAKNKAPYYWLSWKNSGAGHWINIDGNDLS